MKIALCCIGRLENRYALEFVEHYTKLGVDKIFVYDNNYDGEEHFEEVLKDYIDNGIVDIIDYRNKTKCQLLAYQECYDSHKNDYEWFCFFDFDEFIHLKNDGDLKTLLSSKIYDGYDMIHVNWVCYGDNDLLRGDKRKITERFILPIMPLDFKKTYDFPENCHVKAIVRGGLDIKWDKTPHTPRGIKNCCDSSGNACNADSPFTKSLCCDNMFLRHYLTKTLEEWVEIKSKRGYCDGNKDFFKTHNVFDEFFKWNRKTSEKEEYAKSLGYEPIPTQTSENLDIFICTHKPIKPLVSNPIYKVVNSAKINNDTAPNGLKGSFYSEIMSYLWLNKNYNIKDYVGFCHYRKYWTFMNDVPNMDEIFKEFDAIVAKPIKLKSSVYEYYDECHNVEDLDIVEKIINEKHSEYSSAFKAMKDGRLLIPYNMFIMRKQDFIDYCEFIETILNEYLDVVGLDIVKRIEDNKDKYLKDFYPNDTIEYQYRIGGYLAERLTNVFMINRFKRLKWYEVKITEGKYKKRDENK